MTFDELRLIAQRGGMILWERSQRVERLRLSPKGAVHAINFTTGKHNRIRPVKTVYAIEVHPTDPIPEEAMRP